MKKLMQQLRNSCYMSYPSGNFFDGHAWRDRQRTVNEFLVTDEIPNKLPPARVKALKIHLKAKLPGYKFPW